MTGRHIRTIVEAECPAVKNVRRTIRAMRRIFWLYVCGILVASAGGAQAPDTKVITGATLIDVGSGAAVPNSAVVISGSRILQAGPAASVKAPAGADVIDAGGKFLLPGLADMHNHLEDGGISRQQNPVGNLARLLSAGVTTVLNPSVSEADFAKLKSAAAADASPYARFFGTGPGLTAEGDQLGAQNPKPKTVEDRKSVV